MLKNSFKKIGAVVCAFAVAAQLAVLPVNAAYINEDKSVYLGDLKELDPIKLVTAEVNKEATTNIALGMSGNYTVEVDAVFNGKFPTGSAVKGEANSTYFYMGGSGSGFVGAHLMVDATNDTGFKMHLKSDRVNSTTPSFLTYGTKYNIKFKFTEVGTGKGANVTVVFTEYDENGELKTTPFASISSGLRNFSDNNGSSNKIPGIDVKVFTTDGTESSVDLSNMKTYLEIADEIETTVDGDVLSETEATIFELSRVKTTELPIVNTVKNGGSASTYTASSTLKMAEGGTLPEGLKIIDGKIVADVILDGGENEGDIKDYNLILTSKLDAYSDASVSYPIVLQKGYIEPSQAIKQYPVQIKDTEGTEIADGGVISEDITLDAGNVKTAIEWESSDDNILSAETGIVMPTAEDTEVTLTARISSNVIPTYFEEDGALTDEQLAEIAASTAALGRVETYTYTVKGVKSIVDAAIADMKFMSNDVATEVVDMSAPVNEDLVLPSEYAAESRIKFDWATEDTSNVTIKNGIATLVQKTLDEAEVAITGTVSYVKNGVVLHEEEVEIPFTIDMTQDGTADKYIVRCDAAASKNFADCPDDEDTIKTADDICGGDGLPTKGIFGSKIEWTSSVPKAISNSGKTVNRQSIKKLVDLTATISYGDAEAETYKIEDLLVPAKSGSTGGSGGGSGSSSNSNTTVSSTGNRAPITSYKGTLTPNTSVQAGDITTATVASFSDLGDAAWAKEAVTFLANKAIINGKTASSFAPNDDITRAEFAKIVVKAFGLEDTTATVSSFSDVKTSDWYYTAVASAYNKGIIKGYEDGRFGVNDKITRQDMAVIIYRAAQVAGKTIAATKDAVTFADNADIAAYAAEAVATLQKGGVINGMTATTFAPTATATRAQAAQMIYGLVK